MEQNSDSTKTSTSTPTSTETPRIEVILPAEKMCQNTLRYKATVRKMEAADMIYVYHDALRKAFGHLPQRIKITIEEVK